MTVLTIVVFTRSKSIHCTTLHSLMNIHMFCILKNIHMDVHYIHERQSLQKYLKNIDRLAVFEYGSHVDTDSIPALCGSLPSGYQVMVFPAVKEGIDWAKFKRSTLAGSQEPAYQRALEFDTDVDKKISDGIWSVRNTEASVWCMDVKPVDKKIRGGKDPIKVPLDSPNAFFSKLTSIGIKICAFTKARTIMHYTHEAFGTILESYGVSQSG